jgi:formylglycine-generating enzyme required for sulfatase activity
VGGASITYALIFYVGHLPAFAWNQVNRGLLDEPGFRPDFDELFDFGIDPLSTDDVPDEPQWPPMDEIHAYRDEVRVRLMATVPQVDALAKTQRVADKRRTYHVVLEHEVMHHETLLYMIAELDEQLKDGPVAALSGIDAQTVPVRAERVAIPAGRTVLGARFEDQDFGWDNEFPEQVVDVPAFVIDNLPVTHGDYLRFVKDGAPPPHNWSLVDGIWFVRGPFSTRPLAELADRPVQDSQEQAAAYCEWSGTRLPTEAELQRAAYETPGGSRRAYPWGVHALLGNGWEHTSTPFRPLSGFEAWIPGYQGYSADFFDDKHYVVFGGSWATSAPLLRRSFRNWFQPHYPYVFSKFRCVHPA